MLFKNQENVKYYLTIDDDTRVKIVNGNSKLGKGIYAVNLLPGDTPLTLNNGTQLTNVAGSCAGCCSGCKTDCYAVKDAKRHHTTVIKSQGGNTLLARYDRERFFADVQRFIDYNMVAAIRIHSSGEFLSYAYFTGWIDLIKRNPDIKNYDNPYNLQEFIYDDGTEPELENVLHCPAVDEKGRKTGMTCAACKLCISAKPGQKIAVYAH